MAQATENKTRGFLGQLLQIKRPLVPIDIYAAREGTTAETIEKFAKSGLLQIRRYKGRTFVVDLPARPTVSQTENSKEDVFESLNITPPPTIATPQQIKGRPSEAQKTQKSHEPPLPLPMLQLRYLQFEMVTAQKKLKRRWQIAAAVTILALIIISAITIRLYINYRYDLEKLNNTEFVIKTAYSNSRKAAQHAKSLENHLNDSRNTANSLNNKLDLSAVENKYLRGQLSDTREKLEITRQKSIESLNMLNTRIQTLATKIAQMGQPPQTQPQPPRPKAFLPLPAETE